LERYYLDRPSLVKSEFEIAEALIRDLRKPFLAARGGKKGALPAFSELMNDAGGAPPPPKPATKPTPSPKPTPKPAPTPAPKPTPPLKKYIPGVTAKTSFVHRVTKVAGREIGVVEMSLQGRKAKVVEIPAALPGYPVARRAMLVAKRMNELQAKDRLWWTTLAPGTYKGETVVKCARAEHGVLMLADGEWAKEWGVGRDQLARLIVKNMRSAVDPNKAFALGARGESADDRRVAAVKLRMDGDAVFDTDLVKAEDLYNQSMRKDPSYIVAYIRLADLYLKQDKKPEAKNVLEMALSAPGLTEEDRAAIELKLAGL
jgi:tetratricopeptide (TPR) repeat protein